MKLRYYTLRRFLGFLLTLFGITVITFLISRLSADPAAIYYTFNMTPAQQQQIRAEHHFDRPLYEQFVYYILGVLHGDLGYSRVAATSVDAALRLMLPATAELAFFGLLIAVVLGITLGTISAVWKNKLPDHLARVTSLAGVSMPIYWLGLILLLLFYVKFPLFPIGRYTPEIWNNMSHPTGFYVLDSILNLNPRALGDAFWHLILPAITIGVQSTGMISRMMRSSMLQSLTEGYITTARSKGLPEKVVINKHARRSAWGPTTTTIGLTIGYLLSGNVLVEVIFNWPGIGFWTASAILVDDSSALIALVLVAGIFYSLANLIIDLLYVRIDPRVKLEG